MRKRWKMKERVWPLTAGSWAFFTGQPMPEEEGPDRDDYIGLEFFHSVGDKHRWVSGKELWRLHRDTIMDWWLQQYPGTRPRGWWQHEAPEPWDGEESEESYLERHGLLTTAEKIALGVL